jgi:REP element-mobilizing transposase RayT
MFEAESIYHIYNRANGHENLFIEEQNYTFFLDKYFKHISPIAATYSYCLMPNYFHLMIKIKSVEEIKDNIGLKTFDKYETFGKLISKQFSNLFSSYTQSVNKVYNRTGSLFQPNMKKKKVMSEVYFTNLILYIHNNPVKHGFVKQAYDWKFSSIHEITRSGSYRLNSKDVIEWFGGEIYYNKAHQQIGFLESVFD